MARVTKSLRTVVLQMHSCGEPAWRIAEATGLTIPQVTKITGE